MNMKNIRWLLIGAGDIVKSRVAAALSQAENSEIAAIFAPSAGKAEAIAAEYHIPKVFHDFEQALTECDADCVYIATPHHTHVQFARRALETGRHFLCEKPLGINSPECLELLACAKKYLPIFGTIRNKIFQFRRHTRRGSLVEKHRNGDRDLPLFPILYFRRLSLLGCGVKRTFVRDPL